MNSSPRISHRLALLVLLPLAVSGCDAYRESQDYADGYDRERLSALCTWELNGESMRKCAAGLAGQGE